MSAGKDKVDLVSPLKISVFRALYKGSLSNLLLLKSEPWRPSMDQIPLLYYKPRMWMPDWARMENEERARRRKKQSVSNASRSLDTSLTFVSGNKAPVIWPGCLPSSLMTFRSESVNVSPYQDWTSAGAAAH